MSHLKSLKPTIGILFGVACLFIVSTVTHADVLCPRLTIDHLKELHLTEMEQRLVCGDPSQADASGLAWSNIPPAQAEMEMKSFLQSRGFNRPQFKIENGVLNVEVGEPTLVSEVFLHGAPSEVHLEQKRKLLGARLTPALLNDLEHWLDQQLRFNGYGCPKISSQAQADTGRIDVTISAGDRQQIVSVTLNDELGLVPGTLRRYDAFQIGSFFSARDLELTESRILNADLISTNHFLVTCKPDGIHIQQNVNGGPPRTLRVGVGVDTEEILKSEISWRHSRLDNHASLSEIKAYASFRKQNLDGNVRWYFNSYKARQYLKPQLVVSREVESTFEVTSLSFGSYFGLTGDNSDLGWTTEAGPVLEFDNTVVGPGPNSSRNLLLKGKFQLQSHNFEYYQSSPRTGFRTGLNVTLSDRNQLSQVSAQKFSLLSEHLWNWKNYDAPLLILGLRFGLATTITDLSLTDATLPTPFRNYLGGSTDIRGYGRLELPEAGTGALTTAFSSFELRLPSLLPFQIQPLVFYDIGSLGTAPFSLTLPIFTSPGLGCRVDSPIGVFRVTLAHSFAYAGGDPVDPQLSHWQAYFSYGEEF